MANSNSLFIGDPMGEKSVIEISGVTPALAKKMADQGINKAYELLGQYLVLKRDTQLFILWLKLDFKATSNQATLIYNDISEWADQFL